MLYITACECDSQGTVPGTTCEAKGGQCHCKPGVYGRQCDVCAPGFFNKTLQGCTRESNIDFNPCLTHLVLIPCACVPVCVHAYVYVCV